MMDPLSTTHIVIFLTDKTSNIIIFMFKKQIYGVPKISNPKANKNQNETIQNRIMNYHLITTGMQIKCFIYTSIISFPL